MVLTTKEMYNRYYQELRSIARDVSSEARERQMKDIFAEPSNRTALHAAYDSLVATQYSFVGSSMRLQRAYWRKGHMITG
jgi:hypothetical protein